MPRLIQTLPEGPLDLVGDVHGEIDALQALLHRLGVDPDKRTAARPVVFLGDLIDRGPDSVQVVELVSRLADAGIARAVLGNHELNLLKRDRKEGNGWFFGDATDHAQLSSGPARFHSRLATEADQRAVGGFIAELPLVLERDDLRVVHACWNAHEARKLPEFGDHVALSAQFERSIDADLAVREVPRQAAEERAAFANLRDLRVRPDRHLSAVVEEDIAHQWGNPVKLLTSGAEVEVPLGKHFFIGGKWRFVERDRWWLRGVDRPTVVGHYWRRRGALIEGKSDVWDDVAPFAWANMAYCVDYSVGRRYAERVRGRDGRPGNAFDGTLAAMRWPERALVFDDHDEMVPTVP